MKQVRTYFSVLFFLLTASVFAQPEALSPLKTNFELTKKAKELRTYSDIYIYNIDTVSLPFLDEFSRNQFKQYDAEPGDVNVVTQTYYHLYDQPGTTKLDDTVKFMLTRTYLIEYDTVGGVTTQTNTPLDSMLITINDLTQYPVAGTVDTVWPRYNIIDTLWLPSSPDTIYIAIPDLVQDSVKIHFVSSVGDTSLWQDNYAYWNHRYPVNPPTIGVATLDGLDENGYPYDFVNTTLTGIADYLTSKPIDLGGLTASDSVFLSFYYQPQGRGNAPESGDSLCLEFWSPDSSKWYPIWSTAGEGVTDFKHKIIKINSFVYLDNGFQFRFYNYANLSGSLDHWNIDYVYLNKLRSSVDTVRDDVAFTYDPNTLLREFTSMPWRHYRNQPGSYMRDTLSVFQRNNNSTGRLVANSNMSIYYEGNLEGSFNHPSNPSIPAFTNFTTVYDVSTQPFFYDTTGRDTSAIFDVWFRHNTTPDFCRLNDTVTFQQVFENYYAYDDGTAEAAYGPQGTGAKLAYKFTIPFADTLRSVRMHFSPSVNNVSNKAFLLTIWDATGAGGTPGTILYQNTTYSLPVYANEANGFTEYYFDQKFVLNGTFYVGWQQLDADRLNIGFDNNTNNQSKIYYNVGSSWNQTSFSGSLMMRPVFTYAADYWYASVNDNESQFHEAKLWPNPSDESFRINPGHDNSYHIKIFDLNGKLVKEETAMNETTIMVNEMENGLYIVELRDTGSKMISYSKIIIQHK